MLIRVLVRMFGNDEFDLQLYDNVKIGEFMEHLATFSGTDASNLKARAIEESQIRRIDNKHWNKQTKEVNSLRDLKIRDNTAILVEIKDE